VQQRGSARAAFPFSGGAGGANLITASRVRHPGAPETRCSGARRASRSPRPSRYAPVSSKGPPLRAGKRTAVASTRVALPCRPVDSFAWVGGRLVREVGAGGAGQGISSHAMRTRGLHPAAWTVAGHTSSHHPLHAGLYPRRANPSEPQGCCLMDVCRRRATRRAHARSCTLTSSSIPEHPTTPPRDPLPLSAYGGTPGQTHAPESLCARRVDRATPRDCAGRLHVATPHWAPDAPR